MLPDFLAIGHVSKDVGPQGHRLGGTVTYAAITAQRLGLRAAILTRAGADLDVAQALPGIDIHQLQSPLTTIFENVYDDQGRQQRVRALAGPLRPEDVPPEWRAAPIVLLGPLAQEIAPEMAGCFGGLVGVTPQGWMRAWDDQGWVSRVPWIAASEVLAKVDVLVLSEEDVDGDLRLVQGYAELCQTVVLTLGSRGASLHCEGRVSPIAARPAREVDPTGAGDVFAAAFLIRLAECGDRLEAARFAAVVASFSVEQPGTEGIPTRAQVEAWRQEIT